MENKKRVRLNILDYVIICLVLAVAVFFGWRYLHKAPAAANTGDIHFKVYVEFVPLESYNDAKAYIPDKMIANGKYIAGSIESVSSEPCDVTAIIRSNAYNDLIKNVIKPTGEYVNLTFDVKASVDLNSLLTQIGTQEVRIGRVFIIKTKYFEYTGTIVSVDRPN